MLGAVVCIIALLVKELSLLLLGSFVIGIGAGLGQFYRFASIELASEANKGWAVTGSLTGGCCAACLGPSLGLLTRDMLPVEYVGSYLIAVVFGLLNIGTIFLVSFPPGNQKVEEQGDEQQQPAAQVVMDKSKSHLKCSMVSVENFLGFYYKTFYTKRMKDIVTSKAFLEPTMLSIIAQVFMTIIMLNSVVELGERGFSLTTQSLALDMHFLSMFGTGFLTAPLLKNIGLLRTASIAWVILLISLSILVTGVELWNFFIGAILVGVSWNILFSTATVMLSYSYVESERHAVQSLFELFVNVPSGLVAVLSGYLFQTFGWLQLIATLAVLFGIITVLVVVYTSLLRIHPANQSSGTSAHANAQGTQANPVAELATTKTAASGIPIGVEDQSSMHHNGSSSSSIYEASQKSSGDQDQVEMISVLHSYK